MATDLTTFLRENRPEGFRSVPLYFPTGDYLTYFISDEPCFARRLDDVVTLYLGNGSQQLVGCKIKGVKHILRTAGDFGVDVDGGRVHLGFFFFAGAAPDRIDRESAWYEQLKSLAGVQFDRSVLQET